MTNQEPKAAVREWWLDLNTEWFHQEFPEWLTKPPHQHELIKAIEKSAYDKAIAALRKLSMVSPPSRSCTGDEWANVCLKDNCELARQTLSELGVEV